MINSLLVKTWLNVVLTGVRPTKRQQCPRAQVSGCVVSFPGTVPELMRSTVDCSYNKITKTELKQHAYFVGGQALPRAAAVGRGTSMATGSLYPVCRDQSVSKRER